MSRVKVDTRELRQRLIDLGRKIEGKSSRVAAVEMVKTFRERVTLIAPRDTNRYLRGWIQASNQAGDRSPLPPIIQTSRQAEYLSSLRNQVLFWEGVVEKEVAVRKAWYDDRPERAKKGYYNKLQSRIRKAEKRLRDAKKQLDLAIESDGNFVLIGGGWESLRGEFNPYSRKTGRNPYKKRAAQVRVKEYGGDGALRDVAGGVEITLRNLEPHSRIIESKNKVLRDATAHMKVAGVQQASRKAIAAMADLGVKAS